MRKKNNYKMWVLVPLAIFGAVTLVTKVFAIIKEKKRLAVNKTGTLQTV